ncbi:MAG: hypothetical protein IT341_09255 [Chloroflexi bacterium]|nr:hypothetical protein [Chloroflexota bacterium]
MTCSACGATAASESRLLAGWGQAPGAPARFICPECIGDHAERCPLCGGPWLSCGCDWRSALDAWEAGAR